MILHSIEARIAGLHDVRRDLRHHEGIAAQVGEVHQLLPVDHLSGRGVGGFEQRDVFGHVHAFGDCADFQPQVEREKLLRVDDHAAALEALESGSLDGDAVSGRVDRIEHELAGRIGQRGARDPGGFSGERHFGDIDSAGGDVGHFAPHASLIGLRPQRHCVE